MQIQRYFVRYTLDSFSSACSFQKMCEFMKVLNGCHLQAEKLEKAARTLKLYEVAYFSVLFLISFFFTVVSFSACSLFLWPLSAWIIPPEESTIIKDRGWNEYKSVRVGQLYEPLANVALSSYCCFTLGVHKKNMRGKPRGTSVWGD